MQVSIDFQDTEEGTEKSQMTKPGINILMRSLTCATV